MRAIYVQERAQATEAFPASEKYEGITLRQAAVRYAINGAVVVAAGIAMPFAALQLAEVMGWGQSFVGTMLVAVATSLPEAASTIGAMRIGAIDLAVGNLFGSNLFNILILGIDDIAYLKGPLLSGVSPSHVVSGVSAMIMTGAAVVGLHYRPVMRVFKIAGWVSLGLLLTYVLNSMVLYLRGGSVRRAGPPNGCNCTRLTVIAEQLLDPAAGLAEVHAAGIALPSAPPSPCPSPWGPWRRSP